MGVLDGEWAVRDIANHSLVVTKDIVKGTYLVAGYNIGLARPGDGIPASKYDGISGVYDSASIANKDLTAGTLLMYDDFAQSV